MNERIQRLLRRRDDGQGRRLARRSAWARAALLLIVGCACAFAAVQGANLYKRLKTPPRPPTVPFGVNDYGRPVNEILPASLSANDVAGAGRDPERLELREGCAWGNPGRNPYKGTVEQALRRARLPDEVVVKIKHKIEAGDATDRLEITNDMIRTVREAGYFEPRAIKMTFGRTMCVNTRVNFQPGHVERADLYEATDSSGRSYSVMVPYVCGNVSVLGARAERPDVQQQMSPTVLASRGAVSPTGGTTGIVGPQQAAAGGTPATIGTGGGGAVMAASGGGGGGGGGTAVPEPETWSLLVAGFGLMAWFGRRARGRRA